MPVLPAVKRILAVIQVDCLQVLQPDDLIKLLQHTLQIADNVIAGGIDMAGVQADTHFVGKLYPVQDGLYFFKFAAYLAAFTGHGL